MKQNRNKLVVVALILLFAFSVYGQKKPIVIQDQGSFAVGGAVVTAPGTFDPIIYSGDNIPSQPVENPGQEQWRAALAMAKLWTDAVNKLGGNVTLVHLPAIGIKGNTHFPFSDLNNVQIAALMSKWLKEKGLDK